MISEWELWACATHLVRQHGERLPVVIQERLADLAVAGDTAGIATWRAIASRCEQLVDTRERLH